MIDRALIEKLQAQARRERSREVYNLLCRAGIWMLSLLSGADVSRRSVACCPDPA